MDMPRYLLKALEVAKLSEERFMHGAILLKHGKPISIASNKNRNTPGQTPIEATSYHAEIACIRQASPEVTRGAVLYVARFSRKTGLSTISRPCERCWEAIEKAQISKVVYTTVNRYATERI